MSIPISDKQEPCREHPTELERKSEKEKHRLNAAGVGFDGALLLQGVQL
jgi:hypothetical protein